MPTTTKRTVQKPTAAPEFVNPLDNPAQANEEIEKVLKEATEVEAPVIEFPPDDFVELPGGLVKKDRIVKTAIVRELTGADEEVLARASQAKPVVFIDRLLKCGVEQLGDEPRSQTETLLKQLLIGDREQLVLEIRRATYGDELEVDDWRCLVCNTPASLEMQLNDIPSTRLADPKEDATFQVPLRKGGYALVRLATGEDQLALFEKDNMNTAEIESQYLKRCVISITDAAGMEHVVQGFPSLVVNMSVPDRHKILRELKDRQPGPKFDSIKYECETCGEEGTVVVGIGHLFLDFGWF